MGVTRQLDEYEQKVLNKLGWSYKGLKICELGAQHHKVHNEMAEKVYAQRGAESIAIDIAEKYTGKVFKFDLCEPLPSDFTDQFDLITNYGDLEHIPLQYMAFKNTHNLCKIGGVMLHALPGIGNFPHHGLWEYGKSFLDDLAKLCLYEIVTSDFFIFGKKILPNRSGPVGALLKREQSQFPTEEEFGKLEIKKK